MKTLLGTDANPSGWMTQGFYDCYRLRDGAPQRTWRVVRDDGSWVFRMDDVTLGGSVQRNLAEVVERAPNDWLCWDLDALAEACLSLEVETTSEAGASRGLEFQCPDWGAGVPAWDRSFGFFMP